jgi:integrator complex subunit 2
MSLFKTEQILELIESYNQDKKGLDFTPQTLLLFYMLTVNNNASIAESYGHDIIQKAHVIEVVNFIQKHRTRLGLFYSQLLSLIVDQLQHLFHLDVLLTSAKTFPKPSLESSIGWMKDFNEITRILSNPLQDQKKTKLILDYLSELNPSEFKAYENHVVNIIPLLLDQKTRRYVLNSYENLWKIICTRNPMELTLRTVNVLHTWKLTYDDIYKNILVLFGIDKRVFLTPPLLSIFLQVLNSSMIASRKYIQSKRNIAKNADVSLQNTYLLVQEGTILQVLLELCLPSDEITSGDLVQIRKLICGFMHQRFIENPLLAKLIHFQTYDISLLPIAVDGIGSIHICMDFLQELLSQPQLEKQVFGIQLASYICEKYPLQRCIDIACAALDRFRMIVKMTGGFTTKSIDSIVDTSQIQSQKVVDIKATNQQLQSASMAQGTILTRATEKEYELAIAQLTDTLVRFTVAFPFLSIECLQVMEELKVNFRHDDTLRKRVDDVFSTLTETIINNAKK